MNNIAEQFQNINEAKYLCNGKAINTSIERDGFVSLSGNRVCAFSSFRRKAKRKSGNLSERGQIKGFTRSSAYRLCRYLRECVCKYTGFGTLTYRAGFQDLTKAKRDIKVFCQRMCRLYRNNDSFGLFWFVEFTAAGTPHFHFFTTHFIDRRTLSRIWAEVVNDDSLTSLSAGTNITSLKSGRYGSMSYAAKYASKMSKSTEKGYQKAVPADIAWTGRFWGKIGNVAVYAVTVSDIEFSEKVRCGGEKRVFDPQKIKKWAYNGKIRVFSGKIETAGVSFFIIEFREGRLVGQMQKEFMSIMGKEMVYQKGWGGNYGD